MCLAIPGKLIEISEATDGIFRMGKVSFDGIVKEVSLALVPDVKPGDYVLVHVGAAIGVIDEEEAGKTFEAIRAMGELDELEDDDDGQ